MAKGEHSSTELHNVEARVRNAALLVPPNRAVELAADALLGAAARLHEAQQETVQWIGHGIYPPELEAAGEALEKYRLALLRAGRET
jgi:hypothetical protein